MSDPDYGAVRLGADWASAVRKQTIYFGFDSGQINVAPGPGNTVNAYTLPSASRPLVTGVRLRADKGDWLELDSSACSALFWSESAVEKFLLPYYVSAAGPQAYQVLHAINKAWYAYDGYTQVYAIAFAYPSKGLVGPLSLWDTVQVIYSKHGKLQPPSPLLRFLKGQTPFQIATFEEPQPGPTGPAPDVDDFTLVDSLGGREVAEYVSGLRGQAVYVYPVLTPGGLEASTTPISALEPPLFTAYCPAVRPERGTVTISVEVQVDDGKKWKSLTHRIGGKRANIADSVFWTDGAVDMLMLPYYASVEGHWAPWYLMVLLGKWAGVTAVEIIDALELLLRIVADAGKLLLHRLDHAQGAGHPLREALGRALLGHLGEAAAGGAAWTVPGGEGEQTSTVYAIVHLPRSEYVDQPLADAKDAALPGQEGFRLENRTWLLSTSGDYPLVSPPNPLLP